ncbi:hypothetical protein J3458_001128 [Metarhizium acridum]|uniref:uncharacterized protein n=1 Tax=Metarhizium acridum TaxID=92637 RepID=UPI001C6C933C|nr:hypothetical protein J3458_001128 [Metarhizium acridum]
MSKEEIITVILKRRTTYQGSEQPPSGQCWSKSPADFRSASRSGCRSQYTGTPSNKHSFSFSSWKKPPHNSPPFLLFVNVCILPKSTAQFLARDMRTTSRSGAAMNPISPDALLLVKDTMTMSLSSP